MTFSGTNPSLITSMKVEIENENNAGEVQGIVGSVDSANRTITIKGQSGAADQTYSVSSSARIRNDAGATLTLGQITVGSEVKLEFSSTSTTTWS